MLRGAVHNGAGITMRVTFMTSSRSRDLDAAVYQRDGYILLGKSLEDACVQQLITEEKRFRKRDHRLVVLTQLMHRSALIREVATQGVHIAALRQLIGQQHLSDASAVRQQEPASRYAGNRCALASGQRLWTARPDDRYHRVVRARRL